MNEGMGFVLLEFVLIGLVLMDFSLVDIVSESNPNRCMDNTSHALGNRIDQIYIERSLALGYRERMIHDHSA